MRDSGIVFNTLLELAVVQHVVGQVVTDAVELQDLHHGVAEATLGCSGVPPRKSTTLSFFTNASRCSQEPLPPKRSAPHAQDLQAATCTAPTVEQSCCHLAQGPAHPRVLARALGPWRPALALATWASHWPVILICLSPYLVYHRILPCMLTHL